MNINDSSVLDMLNKLIINERLNKSQILHLAELVTVSDNLLDLKENLNWEKSKTKD